MMQVWLLLLISSTGTRQETVGESWGKQTGFASCPGCDIANSKARSSSRAGGWGRQPAALTPHNRQCVQAGRAVLH